MYVCMSGVIIVLASLCRYSTAFNHSGTLKIVDRLCEKFTVCLIIMFSIINRCQHKQVLHQALQLLMLHLGYMMAVPQPHLMMKSHPAQFQVP